ncbi:MAG: hypothetical protein Q8Q65_02360, partial [bacterium]|nr:hypothetical protein [bacterium]
MMKQKKLKVGFDFDGVLYYNPARIVRLPIKLLKEHFLPKRQLKFWKPQTAWQKELWLLAHKTSLFPAAGYKHLLQLLEEKQFHGYIITGRYGYLKPEFEQRLNKCDPHNLFQGYYLNEKSMQPHKFKEQTIKKLE